LLSWFYHIHCITPSRDLLPSPKSNRERKQLQQFHTASRKLCITSLPFQALSLVNTAPVQSFGSSVHISHTPTLGFLCCLSHIMDYYIDIIDFVIARKSFLTGEV